MSDKLSEKQLRTLTAIRRMQDSGEDGHDISGDLSICSGNSPATIRSLERRGLVEGRFDAYAPEDMQWTYRLTRLGQRELEIRHGA